ncbi:MAG: helix-turn-helix domain-containing protein [Phycisphaerales bacterium]
MHTRPTEPHAPTKRRAVHPNHAVTPRHSAAAAHHPPRPAGDDPADSSHRLASPAGLAEAITARIQQICRRFDHSIRQVGTGTGFHHESVRRWLRGLSPAPAHFLWPFCEFTGVSIVWLVSGKGPMLQSKLPAHWIAFADDATIWKALSARLPRDAHGNPILPPLAAAEETDSSKAVPAKPVTFARPARASRNPRTSTQQDP